MGYATRAGCLGHKAWACTKLVADTKAIIHEEGAPYSSVDRGCAGDA